jgi:hypothetical protein
MWNHVIGQKQSHWLRLDLGNVFWGCGNHNMLDYHGDKTFFIWYCRTFHMRTAEAMNEEKQLHKGKKREIYELEEMLAHYEQLYQNRYYVELELDALINAGYYGEIVRKAWKA